MICLWSSDGPGAHIKGYAGRNAAARGRQSVGGGAQGFSPKGRPQRKEISAGSLATAAVTVAGAVDVLSSVRGYRCTSVPVHAPGAVAAAQVRSEGVHVRAYVITGNTRTP
uniref:Uncharacterized protein n=1 Tax=Sipha flava TaxID=143950 RepID=A0A2S2QDH9_9HEMI